MASQQLNAQMFAILPPLFTLLVVHAIRVFFKSGCCSRQKIARLNLSLRLPLASHVVFNIVQRKSQLKRVFCEDIFV